jgi:hypothetical protein
MMYNGVYIGPTPEKSRGLGMKIIQVRVCFGGPFTCNMLRQSNPTYGSPGTFWRSIPTDETVPALLKTGLELEHGGVRTVYMLACRGACIE